MLEPSVVSSALAVAFVGSAIVLRLKGRLWRREDTDVIAPVLSTSIENPVLIIHGYAQLVQDADVVFDTRQGHHPTEDVVDRAGTVGQHRPSQRE